jgi:hypothetical protein
MLGDLLEFGVAADPIAAALDSYQRMGFQSVPVGDIVTEPYAVLAAGGLHLGLRAHAPSGPVPTFVRPDLKAHRRALRHAGVDIELAELADDQFHRLSFRDPNGQAVILLEARTFAPADATSAAPCLCGRFLELSVATRSCDRSQQFWSALGFAPVARGEAPYPWLRLAGHGLVIGFHETAPFPAGLTFRSANLDGRLGYFRARGLETAAGAPLAPRPQRAATLAPHGLPFYLIEEGDV